MGYTKLYNKIINNDFDIADENEILLQFINKIKPLITHIIITKIGKNSDHFNDILHSCILLIIETIKKKDKTIVDIKGYIIKSVLNYTSKYLKQIEFNQLHSSNEVELIIDESHEYNIYGVFNKIEKKIIDLFYSGKNLKNISKELQINDNNIYIIWNRIKFCLKNM